MVCVDAIMFKQFVFYSLQIVNSANRKVINSYLRKSRKLLLYIHMEIQKIKKCLYQANQKY